MEIVQETITSSGRMLKDKAMARGQRPEGRDQRSVASAHDCGVVILPARMKPL